MIAPFTKIERDRRGRIVRAEPLRPVRPAASLPLWNYGLWRAERDGERVA